ncbi:MAG: hypothetical protein M3O36_01940 [Myxococcota bacterium]|nr:hypothetical protein [Myxococcota bacterium]
MTLAWRRDTGWLLEATRGADAITQPTSPSAMAVLDHLGLRGALFLEDLTIVLGLSPAELAEAIWDLVGRGLVTSDGFQPLRQLISAGRNGARQTDWRTRSSANCWLGTASFFASSWPARASPFRGARC